MGRPAAETAQATFSNSVVMLGQVLAGAVPFKAGNINDTFRGVVLTDAGERSAFIKDLEPRELANEVFAAALGLGLGLPVPPPCLALAMPDRLAASKGPILNGGRLVFASVDVNQPQVAMLYVGGAREAVLARLAQWQQLGHLYGFDALVANIDRHEGNLLFSGDREVWLIDHGHCFTGPGWVPADLAPPDRTVVNRLKDWLTPALNETQRVATANVATRVEIETARIDVRALAMSNHLAELLGSGDLEAVVAFVNERCAHIPRLASAALGLERLV